MEETKKAPFKWEIGRVYRARTGELIQLMKLDDKTGTFQMLDENFEPSSALREGPRDGLDEMAEMMGLEPVTELKKPEPKQGLILSQEDPRWRH